VEISIHPNPVEEPTGVLCFYNTMTANTFAIETPSCNAEIETLLEERVKPGIVALYVPPEGYDMQLG
jgi:hypothetical protein